MFYSLLLEFRKYRATRNNKYKVLLLLDGYDEIAFLSQNNRDYNKIMETVFQYKNVIMTSRPNAVTENINGER